MLLALVLSELLVVVVVVVVVELVALELVQPESLEQLGVSS